MTGTIVISVITLLALILSIIFFPNIKIKKVRIPTYVVIALLGAILLMCLGYIPGSEIGSALSSNTSVNPLKILVLFFSMTFLSIFLDEVGFFSFLANKCVKKVSNSQLSLFLIFYFLISFLTIFTSNDIVILTMTPFICYLCKNTKINPIPYLVAEFAAANTWSMIFIIGNPTNIYLGTNAGIDFVSYLKVMAVPTLLTGLVELLILLVIFWKKLKLPIERIETDEKPINKIDVGVGLFALLSCLILLIISSYINGLEMWIAAVSAFGFLLIYSLIVSLKRRQPLIIKVGKALPYSLIPFVLSMFIIVLAFNYQGISKEIYKILGTQQAIYVYGSSSFLMSNLMNNIPMSILYSNIISNASASTLGMTYASIIGSNLGAFLTPVGALAGIMFTNLVNKQEVKYTFLDFIKYGLIISLPCLLIALSSLQIFVQ